MCLAQLRSGRPRRRHDLAAPQAKKRARRASKSSSTASSPTLCQPSPPSSLRRAATLPNSLSSVGLGQLETLEELSREPRSQHSSPSFQQNTPLPSPTAASPPLFEPTSHPSALLNTPPLTEHWETTPYCADSTNPMMGGMCQMATFATIPSVPTAPLFPDSTTHMVPPTEHAMDGYTWGYPATSDNLLQELGDIDFRIHQARRSLLLPHCTPAPWSSPGVNEAFDAACSLVDVVDRFAAKRRMPSSDVHLASIGSLETALETSTRLMIHSCHEALLGIFEHLSASLLSHLSHPQHQQTPPRTPPHAAAFLPQQGNPQAAIVANSIRHLISQLDRAISSLSGTYYNTQPDHQSEHETLQASSVTNLMGHTSHVSGVPVTFGGGDENWLGNIGNPLFNEMEQRQARVGGQIKTVERLLRQPIMA